MRSLGLSIGSWVDRRNPKDLVHPSRGVMRVQPSDTDGRQADVLTHLRNADRARALGDSTDS